MLSELRLPTSVLVADVTSGVGLVNERSTVKLRVQHQLYMEWHREHVFQK